MKAFAVVLFVISIPGLFLETKEQISFQIDLHEPKDQPAAMNKNRQNCSKQSPQC